jgi:lipid IVA palmitoyltransferase
VTSAAAAVERTNAHVRTLAAAALLVTLTAPTIAGQSPEPWYGRAWHTLRDPDAPTWYRGIGKTWIDTFTKGDTSILIPINTFHIRFAYPPEKVARYTEWPLGLGLARTHVGEKASRVVFALTMQDSHGTLEYELGYLWVRNRYPLGGVRDFYFGFGYTLDVLIREQFGYQPLPILLPVASIGYKRLSIGTTYVPGGDSYGNVLVTGAHVSF